MNSQNNDLYNNVTVLAAIKPVAVGTTGIAGGTLSGAIDRRGYGAVLFGYQSGGSASVADTITPVIYESTVATSGFTSVADADLLGTEDALTLSTSAGKVDKVGYKGTKRYLKIRLYGVGTATALVSAQVHLANASVDPAA